MEAEACAAWFEFIGAILLGVAILGGFGVLFYFTCRD